MNLLACPEEEPTTAWKLDWPEVAPGEHHWGGIRGTLCLSASPLAVRLWIPSPEGAPSL